MWYILITAYTIYLHAGPEHTRTAATISFMLKHPLKSKTAIVLALHCCALCNTAQQQKCKSLQQHCLAVAALSVQLHKLYQMQRACAMHPNTVFNHTGMDRTSMLLHKRSCLVTSVVIPLCEHAPQSHHNVLSAHCAYIILAQYATHCPANILLTAATLSIIPANISQKSVNSKTRPYINSCDPEPHNNSSPEP